MAEQKQGGLGKGLAALIPSGPDAPTRKPRLGDSAADIILGNATPQPGRKAVSYTHLTLPTIYSV